MDSEKFCLQWNSFQKNIASSYKVLREDQEFSDVTLVSADNTKFEAHRVILSSASSFLKSMISGNNHSHPLIYMRGIKTKYLKSILDFIYHGQVNVEQDDLNDFLQLAEELELKGLSTVKSEIEEPPIAAETKQRATPSKAKISKLDDENIEHVAPESSKANTLADDIKSIIPFENTTNHSEESTHLEAKMFISFKDETNELNKMINSMLEYEDGHWKCGRCGQTKKDKTRVKRHIETHIDGISHPCGHCDKSLKTRNALQSHIYKHHTVHGNMDILAVK